MKLLSSAQSSNSNPALAAGAGMTGDRARDIVTPMSIRAAVTVVTATPILIVYPFLQKYFVVGLTIGGVKE